ncbi:multicopper oxidase-domain-containing protein [Nemania abortiva]|nr:multicopper oxidase-domain-containing protein [Nemania abortiva]
MWIYEVDGQFIEPIRADVLGSWAGERYSAMIKLDQKPQDYPLRVADTGFTQILGGYAILRYENTEEISAIQNEPFLSYRGDATIPSLAFNGELLNNASKLDKHQIHPFPASDRALKPASHADVQHIFHMSRVNISWKTSIQFPYLYPPDHNAYAPLLYNPNTTEGYDMRYVIRHNNGTWVDLVLQLGEYPRWFKDLLHPMHKHGNKFFLIGGGNGTYNFSSVSEAIAADPSNFNLENPPLRDTVAGGFRNVSWVVIRYQVVEPGAWLFHCHVETHLAAGMAMAILDGVDVWPVIPPEYASGQHGLPVSFWQRPSHFQIPLVISKLQKMWRRFLN